MSSYKKLKLEWLIPYSDYLFQTENGVLCTLCNTELVCTKKSHIERHVNGANHLKRKKSIPGPSLSKEPDATTAEFCMDLCEAFIAADIPLHKLNKPSIKSFLGKYCKRSIPDESTLRKKYVEQVYCKTMDRVRQDLIGKKIWFSIDETTDIKGRYVANVIVGPLSPSNFGGSYLINSKFLSKTNNETIAQTAKESLISLFPETNSIRENVLLLLTNDAAYMRKAGEHLKEYFPNVLHLTCLAHALHKICEVIRECYSKIDNLISEVKKIFLKSPACINIFKEMCPNVPLPPQPVITQWGTWLLAVMYYKSNFDLVKNVVTCLKDDAQSVKKCKEIITMPDVKNDLEFISDNFGDIPYVIEKLESSNLPLVESFSLFEATIEKLKAVPTKVGEKLKTYLERTLKRNSGYSQIKDIVEILKNQEDNKYGHFSYAPVTSCEVERSFSRLRDVLNYKRTNLIEANFKKLLIISYNCNKI